MSADTEKLKRTATSRSLPFALRKLGHVVIRVSDLQRAVDFCTSVLGLRISDVYPEEMMPGVMVFLRFNVDHHGIALVGG